jgi:hypothetical protein
LILAYIYKIINDINDKIYIGKTEFSIEKRFKEHCRDAFKDCNEKRPLYAAMRKYGVEHFYIELLEETDSPEEREMYWIELLGSFKYGYNATMGGDGKKYLDYDLIFNTYLQYQNVKQTALALSINPETVSRVVKSYGGEIKSSQSISKEKFSKSVQMLDKNNTVLQIFISLTDAAKYLIDNNYTKSKDPKSVKPHIQQCANGKRKTAYGFVWKWN